MAKKKKKHNTLSGQRISQHPVEINDFKELMAKHGCTSYLEIGARFGDTFYDVVKSMPAGSKAVAVDLVDGYWGREGSDKHLNRASAKLNEAGYDTHTIYGDSTEEAIIEAVREHGPFDCIFIDGDHRYEGVKKDFLNYLPMAVKIVGFHDINSEGLHNQANPALKYGVYYLWQEIKEDFEENECHEFIKEETKRPMGIGALVICENSTD